jgi:hypothetical protein
LLNGQDPLLGAQYGEWITHFPEEVDIH